MFARCLLLLPALLLLAAIVYCTAVDLPPVGTAKSYLKYKATKFKGRTNIPLTEKATLSIPKNQCDGEIDPLGEYIKCGVSKIAVVQVTVRDSKPKITINISDDLNRATIFREKPCEYAAPVDLEVGCESASLRNPFLLGLL